MRDENDRVIDGTEFFGRPTVSPAEVLEMRDELHERAGRLADVIAEQSARLVDEYWRERGVQTRGGRQGP